MSDAFQLLLLAKSVLLIMSLGFNIYLYRQNKAITQELHDLYGIRNKFTKELENRFEQQTIKWIKGE